MRIQHLALVVAAAGLVWTACNEHPLSPIDESLTVERVEASREIGTNKVDILWVIDDSGSMCAEQKELADKFDTFVADLVALDADFHIAVVSTDMQDPAESGRFQQGPPPSPGACSPLDEAALRSCRNREDPRKILARDDYVDENDDVDIDALQSDFRCISAVGTAGSGFEKGLEAARTALSPELLADQNEDGGRTFLREDAFLSIIFLTDEEDCSDGGALNPVRNEECYWNRDDLIPVDTFVDYFRGLKGEDGQVLIAGIIGPTGENYTPPTPPEPPTRSCTSAFGDAFAGTRYHELIDSYEDNGIEASICRGDFSVALDAIGDAIGRNLETICLEQQPTTCENNRDCRGDATCINPVDPNTGLRLCSDFEVLIEVKEPDSTGFRPLTGPGPASDWPGDLSVYEGTDVDYWVNPDAEQCPSLIGFTFQRDRRPDAASFFRSRYPVTIDTITARDRGQGAAGGGGSGGTGSGGEVAE